MNIKQDIRYGLYIRKSCEAEDRQVQSLEDQTNAMVELAERLDIHIAHTFDGEAKSAKKPNNRPIYTQMMDMIQRGKIDGILCWQLNRLSRNPVDSGELSWLLQTGVLKSIQTIDKEYRPEDNVLLFNIESGVANQFIIDLKKSSMRGMVSKAEKGWLPSRAPLGYLNNTEEHTIEKDPERFHLVRKMWDMMLTGNYTPKHIADIATNEWGMTTPLCKHSGGGAIVKTTTYAMFGNIFFTGRFSWRGNLYSGNHEPMVSIAEFDEVQRILGRHNRPRTQERVSPYNGLIACPCGGSISPSEKHKLCKTTGEKRIYKYCRCSRNKKGVVCKEPPINVEQLEEQIVEQLDTVAIAPEFLEWAFETIDENVEKDKATSSETVAMQEKTLLSKQRELKNLTHMRLRDLIDDTEFTGEKARLTKEIHALEEQHEEAKKIDAKGRQLKETLAFVSEMKERFMSDETDTEKRGILSYVGTGHMLTNRTLTLSFHNWLVPVQTSYKKLESLYTRSELENTLVKQGRKGDMGGIRTAWGRDPNFIITTLSDREYMVGIREKLTLIQQLS